MPPIDLVIETPIGVSVRAAQVSSMFDVPAQQKARLEWHGVLPIEERSWNVGLIVGPSGSGKSTILRYIFGAPVHFTWGGASVIDDFVDGASIDEIARICQAVGFNTIPAWLRPYEVLSNGERFRVDLARRLLECGDPIACDEFTSVVDRQVAQIGSHAVQKHVRSLGRKFVAAACHYDLEEWLQPDWVFEPATMKFRWRELQRRPSLSCTIARTAWESWSIFARFHYLTGELHRAARCFLLRVGGAPAACAAMLHRPHATAHDIWGVSRLVTLPDFQGLGLAFALADRVAAAYRALGRRVHTYPAHPSLVRSFDRSPSWRLVKKPGFSSRNFARGEVGKMGGRPCAVFAYCGPAMEPEAAALLVG